MPTPLNLYSTYEDLMAYKLQNTSDELDKREVTSLLFNAFANNSLETVQMLYTLQYGIDMVFADTAPREYLIRRAAERGLAPFPATFAIRKGTFNIDVPIGSRFSIEDVNYTVIKKIDPLVVGEFELRAETAGIIGNSYYGALIPITYIAGLSVALLTDILIPGEDEESTEAFRIRYFNSFESTSFGGNRADYKRFTNAIPGVGGSKVYRAWNGGGTVKVVIVDSQFKVPSQALIDDAQNRIDPIGLQGEGVGTAPIDHIVTVVGATPTTIDVAFTITFETGWEWSDIEIQVQNMIDRYFEELGGIWASAVTYDDDHSGVAVRVSQLETRLLGIVGVLDVTNTLLNGQPNNVNLGMEEIPVRGTVIG